MIISISGTPGCGKTTVSKALAKKLKYKLLDLNKTIKKNKIYSGYDRKRKTYIVDINKLKIFFRKVKKEDVVVDSHLSHYLPVDMIIVLRCKPDELDKRMRLKKWNKEKRRENFEAELISLISYEARELNREVYDIDTTKRKVNSILKDITKILKGQGSKFKKPISWM